MAVTGYDQTMRVDTAASLPIGAAEGSFAFAEDTKRHYMQSNGSWFRIPNAVETAAIRYCENGSFKNGLPMTGDLIIFTDSVTTSGGKATFYATSNKLSTGTALCSYVSGDSFQPNYRDSTGIYLPGAVVVSGDNKSIAQSFSKQTFTGITILTNINVLGSTSNTAIPDGVIVKASYWGVAL